MNHEHEPSYDVVIKGREGERLRLGRTDDEAPGWVWCTAESGIGSWVPEIYLEREGDWARLTRDYDATELAVSAGERIVMHQKASGWWWVTNEAEEQGWVPAGKITSE